MGELLVSSSKTTNMKAFVAMFAAVAAAAAEPWGYGLYGHPLVLGKSAPCVNAANVPVPCAAGHLYGKREAEADPALVYGAGLVHHTAVLPAVHPEYRRAYNVIAKREAEADPTLYFVNPVGHRYGFPHNGFGQELIHSSNFGVCTNYLGQQVAC